MSQGTPQTGYHVADDRAVLRVSGDDRIEFLQGIISSDAARVSQDIGLWAAFLTPQGKYLHDFFLVTDGEDILIDCEAARVDDLRKRLRRYTLRSAVTVKAEPALAVALAIGTDAPIADMAIQYADPRHAEAGWRWIGPENSLRAAARAAGLPQHDRSAWDVNRINLGLPDGSRDFEIERSTLAEGNADLLGAVDWQKGCWMGQEVTARMHYRGLAKRRLVPMRVQGPVPAPGTNVEADGMVVGDCRSSAGDLVMVLTKIDVITGAIADLAAGDASLTPAAPDWLLSSLNSQSGAGVTAV